MTEDNSFLPASILLSKYLPATKAFLSLSWKEMLCPLTLTLAPTVRNPSNPFRDSPIFQSLSSIYQFHLPFFLLNKQAVAVSFLVVFFLLPVQPNVPLLRFFVLFFVVGFSVLFLETRFLCVALAVMEPKVLWTKLVSN